MKLHIHDLMENIEDSSVRLEETDVVSSDKIKELTKMKLNMTETNTRHRGKKKALTIGIAAAVVAALGIASYAAFSGSLENVTFGKPKDSNGVELPVSESKVTNDNGDEYTVYENNESISVQGYSDSPEYKAAKEWHEFEDNYDTDWKILDKVGNKATKWDEKYGAYNVYSQEMADKVDEITSKYNLKLHEPLSVSDSDADTEKFNEMYGTVMDNATYDGYYFTDGTFQFDGDYGKYDFQLRRTVKGVFDNVYLGIGDMDEYEQWEYKTASGVTVLLALSKDQAIIIADLDKSFVNVNVLLWMGEDDKPDEMSKAELEKMADQIHFDIL